MTPSGRQRRLNEAEKRSKLARMRFTTALSATKRRLSFDRLRDDARLAASEKVEEAKDNVRRTIRSRPFTVGAIVAGGLALIFWAPARLVGFYGARAAHLIWLNRKLWSSKE